MERHDVHPSVLQTPSVGLTSSCNEARLREELQWERLRSNKLERFLANLRKELHCQRKEFDCELASSSQLLKDADWSREELEKRLSKALEALTDSGCILLRTSLQKHHQC